MIIRSEKQEDIEAIGAIHCEAFGHTLEKELIENVRREASFDKDFSLVAEENGEVIGHILFNKVTVENSLYVTPALMLAPMAIRESYRGKGIGTLLINEGIKRAKEHGYGLILVCGHTYYDRFGFVITHKIFRQNPIRNKHLRVLELTEGALENVTGVVHYPVAFSPTVNEWLDPHYKSGVYGK